jgi:hypothetical protein
MITIKLNEYDLGLVVTALEVRYEDLRDAGDECKPEMDSVARISGYLEGRLNG